MTKNSFWDARGRAIQAYADLEQNLCLLLAAFSGMPLDIAAIVFFKITSSRARDAILEKLLKKKHGSTLMAFWKSLESLIGQLTETRNHIVHWNANVFRGEDGIESIELKSPSVWGDYDKTPAITKKDILDFIDKCLFVSRLCNHFAAFLVPQDRSLTTEEQEQAWHDIFQQPVVYPPPDNHPLCQKPKAAETQLPPSQESPPLQE